MDKKQRELAIASVQEDCLTRGTFKNPLTGETCAVGGLADSMGYEWGSSISLMKTVENFYGITNDQLWSITDINDRYVTVKARRKNVIKFLESIKLVS